MADRSGVDGDRVGVENLVFEGEEGDITTAARLGEA
jgi:hypothetical protein